MKTITSVSGGQTSAYIAANYASDYLLFSLVRIEDKDCEFPDKKLRQEVEDRIQKPFIATAEDDTIIYTMLDLEQYLGKKINWVSGMTFDEVIRSKNGWLPNKLHRYCTTWLKIDPMFYWWAENIGKPVKMQIGFRANEQSRAKRMNENLNDNGLIEYKATFGKWEEGAHKGKNKWENIEWQKPVFPLIKDGIFKDNIVKYWNDKPVRFAKLNNCVHCFHKNPMMLKLQSQQHPNKFEWAKRQEGGDNGYWRSDIKYADIIKYKTQTELDFNDFSDCDTGYCGL